jgi:ABC-type glucose/galactose transport system permease subunit
VTTQLIYGGQFPVSLSLSLSLALSLSLFLYRIKMATWSVLDFISTLVTILIKQRRISLFSDQRSATPYEIRSQKLNHSADSAVSRDLTALDL